MVPKKQEEMLKILAENPYRKVNILYLAAIVGLFAVYIPVFYYLYDSWLLDPYYSHGFIIPLVSSFLIYTSRRKVKEAADENGHHPILLLIIGFLIYIMAIISDFRFLMYISFVLSLGGIILFLWGPKLLNLLFFPIAYILLMFPLPYSVTSGIAFPLQLFSSRYAALLLNILDISALREGVNIYVPGYSFIIERGCSGLQSIIALISLSVLFAYLAEGPVTKKLFLVFSSIPIALMANVVRIVTVILVARTLGKDVAESFFHNFSSLFLFSLAFLLLAGTARYIGCLPSKR